MSKTPVRRFACCAVVGFGAAVSEPVPALAHDGEQDFRVTVDVATVFRDAWNLVTGRPQDVRFPDVTLSGTYREDGGSGVSLSTRISTDFTSFGGISLTTGTTLQAFYQQSSELSITLGATFFGTKGAAALNNLGLGFTEQGSVDGYPVSGTATSTYNFDRDTIGVKVGGIVQLNPDARLAVQTNPFDPSDLTYKITTVHANGTADIHGTETYAGGKVTTDFSAELTGFTAADFVDWAGIHLPGSVESLLGRYDVDLQDYAPELKLRVDYNPASIEQSRYDVGVSITRVPEPSSVLMFGPWTPAACSWVAIAFRRRKRNGRTTGLSGRRRVIVGIACALGLLPFRAQAGPIGGITAGTSVTVPATARPPANRDDMNTATTMTISFISFSPEIIAAAKASKFSSYDFVFAGQQGIGSKFTPIDASDFAISQYNPWVVNNNDTTNDVLAPDGKKYSRGIKNRDAGGADIVISYTPRSDSDPTRVNFLQDFVQAINEGMPSNAVLDFGSNDPECPKDFPYYNRCGTSGTGRTLRIKTTPLKTDPNTSAWMVDIPARCENGPIDPGASPNCNQGRDETITSEVQTFQTFIEADQKIGKQTYHVLYGGIQWGYTYTAVDVPEPAAATLLGVGALSAILGRPKCRRRTAYGQAGRFPTARAT